MDRRVVPHDALKTMSSETQVPPGVDTPAARDEPMRHTRKAFEQIGRMKAPARPFFERFFDRLLPALPDSHKLDWGDEADWARLQQEPLRARWLIRIVVAAVVSLLVWAELSEIDEVTRGEGKVIPSSQIQVIQAVDQGQVEEILVQEGQTVSPKQLLLRIDKSRYMSELGAADAERLSLMAKVARLQALLDNKEFVMPEEVLKSDPGIAAQEREHYRSSLDEAEYQLSGIRQQLAQRQQELKEVQAAHTQAANGLRLAMEELGKNEPLLESGAVSEVEIIRLKQNVEKFDGDRKQAAERIGRAQAAIDETQSKLREAELTKHNQWRRELFEASSRLATVTAGAGVSQDRVKHAEVRSPVRGTVNRLLVNTVGGVVQSGKDLVEIVPLEDTLLIEAKIKPKDIGFLHQGLPTLVKITAYDYSIYGGLDGTLEHISGDTVTDEKGVTFYVIKVKTKESTLAGKAIAPGMVAEVDVKTGKKTVLSYLLKPVLRAKANAMTER
ncbi:MAG: HlyD family type I secretion periplasmic adaptor subunit [Azoarcus sp.]|jgi:adhesin transport system membrane fusion protein|nr:HlyD family type I secretion periplasmic adaptor subunit [Azoarcus sp.]